MKLIVKRIGPDPRHMTVHGMDNSPRPMRSNCDPRPLGLCLEDGTVLPCQSSVVIESVPHDIPKITVTFYLDDESISLE